MILVFLYWAARERGYTESDILELQSTDAFGIWTVHREYSHLFNSRQYLKPVNIPTRNAFIRNQMIAFETAGIPISEFNV